MSYTPEPWYVGEKAEIDGEWITADRCVGGYTGRDVYDRDAGVWAPPINAEDEPYTICKPYDEQDARRIVACVNALAGLTDEQVQAIPRLVAWFHDPLRSGGVEEVAELEVIFGVERKWPSVTRSSGRQS